jgi:hypothetical protein
MNDTFKHAIHHVTGSVEYPLQPYQYRAACGHIVTRMNREETCGVPYSPDVILEAPNGRMCEECESTSRFLPYLPEGAYRAFRNINYTERDYECTNVVACVAKSAPDANYEPCGDEVLEGLTPLWIQGDVRYWGHM